MATVVLADPEVVSLYAERRSAGPNPDGTAAGARSVRTKAWQAALPAVAAAHTRLALCTEPFADGAAVAVALTDSAVSASAATTVARRIARMDPPGYRGYGQVQPARRQSHTGQCL